MPDRFVNVTTDGGLKQEELFGVPDAAAKTSKTSICIVVSSVQPKLSVIVKEIEPIPVSSNKKDPGLELELVPGIAGETAVDAVQLYVGVPKLIELLLVIVTSSSSQIKSLFTEKEARISLTTIVCVKVLGQPKASSAVIEIV